MYISISMEYLKGGTELENNFNTENYNTQH